MEPSNIKCHSGNCEGIAYEDLSNTESGVMIVYTVRKQFEVYTKQEVEKARLSHELQGMIGYLSDRE